MSSEQRIIVYGNFQLDKLAKGGQITKTRNVYEMLTREFGKTNVGLINMEHWKKTPLKIVRSLKKVLYRPGHIVVLPGDNNLKFLLFYLRTHFRKIKSHIHYMVVGGWLYDYLKKSKKNIQTIKMFSGIYVETKDLLRKLESLGLTNVFYSPVFSLRKPVTTQSIDKSIDSLKKSNVIKICTFSRVSKEKGISDAISAVKILNDSLNTKCILDIYGPIDEMYANEFNSLLKANKNINYNGFIPDGKVIETLSQYHLMVFATYFYGEGFPACLLESYMAGLPVVATDWMYNKELVDQDITGKICKPKDPVSIANTIFDLVQNKKLLYGARYSCLEKANQFSPEMAMKPINSIIKTLDSKDSAKRE